MFGQKTLDGADVVAAFEREKVACNVRVATRREAALWVVYKSKAATHASSKILPSGAEDQSDAACHVFARMIA
jgi:hypothetical protein